MLLLKSIPSDDEKLLFLLSTVISSRLLQFQKDVSSIDVVFAGTAMLFRLLQSANAFSPILAIPEGSVTLSRLLQPLNVQFGITVSFEGMFISLRLVQDSKLLFPNSSMLSPRTALLSSVQPKKVLSGILFNPFPTAAKTCNTVRDGQLCNRAAFTKSIIINTDHTVGNIDLPQ